VLKLPWLGYGPTRNNALREAGSDWFFFVDADIGFTPEAAFRLLLADRDVARAFIR
jgi:glycosyltransferase involved in cell wall biosynthesis